MNPKDKAKELVDKFTLVGLQQRNEGIQCALIAVNMILDSIEVGFEDWKSLSKINYYQEVKKEIEKL